MNRLFVVLMCLVLSPAVAPAGDWWEACKIKGDLRYRHEMIDTDDSDTRHRHRIRARIAVEGTVSDMTRIHLQLATGSEDPVSTNQTLDNGFSTKPIMLDLAYLEIEPARLPGLVLRGGKFKNPFFKPGSSELLWDSDLNPEGGVVSWTKDAGSFSLLFLGSGLWIEERSTADDSWMAAGQGVIHYNMGEGKPSWAFGAGFFKYANTAGFEPFFDGEAMGNSLDSLGYYLTDYEILELFAEFNHYLGTTPLTLMGDFAANTAADSSDQGWLVGVRAGAVRKPGSWAVRYIYRELEKDAVIGAFTDSDFRGGGTDAKGHEIGGSLQLAKNTTFNVTYFMNKIGLEGAEEDFARLQVDLQLKFK